MIKNIPVQQAHEQVSKGETYLDVRSVPEFEQGHPAGAYNIPLLHMDPDTRQMFPNHDFLTVVQATFAPETPLVVGCQAGARSMQACQVLSQAGYTQLANVAGGFRGSRTGDQGWVDAALPVETAADAARQYETLQARAAGPAR
ncbi:MAG TPA: rhodanese-like domain-containing protein [Vicinamibacterales bacterium]|nr:rhodanese-like domain-containing protein [Vicinamibacterales bacterium]